MKTYNIEQLRELMPLYVNSTLSEKEKKKFEDGLKTYSELQEELNEFSEIKSIYTEMKDDLPTPSDRIFQRVQNQIKVDKRATSNADIGGNLMTRVRHFFEDLSTPSRLSWGLVAVQMAVILMLVVSFPQNNRFTTLTSGSLHQADKVELNVVFDADATEQEIRNLLNQAEAMIVNGPTREGLYTLEVKSDRDIDQLIKDLEGAKPVKFIQRALSEK